MNRIVSLVGNPNKAIKFTLQIEKGNTATPYEPYTGLKPSPSPEYPQAIKNAGKWNEGTQKYEIDVKVTGRNLFDAKKAKSGWISSDGKQTLATLGSIDNVVSDYIQVYPGMKYTSSVGVYKYFYDSEKIFLKQDASISSSIIIPDNAKYMIVIVPVNKALAIQTANTLMINIGSSVLQIENGTIRSNYEPYQEPQTLTLTSDRPITKWDKLTEHGGQYGWMYQSAAKEYIGDNSVELYDNGFYFKLSDKKIKQAEGYCEELKQYVNREENPCIAFNMSANIYAYTLNTQEIYGSTVSETKEYLKSHPLHLVYKTEATEFVPLSESVQTQLRNLHSYNGTTNIMVDSGEVTCGIKVAYKQKK